MSNHRESGSATTVKTRLTQPLNGTIYTTTYPVPTEKSLPALGQTMEAELGRAFANSRVVAVTDGPDKSKATLTITHADIPAETIQRLTNWEHTTCDIGGQKFDGVSRTVIIPAEEYDEAAPVAGSAMPIAGSDGLFHAGAYIFVDKTVVQSGLQLEPVFRVVKLNYVRMVTLTDYEAQPETGVANQVRTTIYASGMKVGTAPAVGQPDNRPTIDSLFASPTNDFWKTDSQGFGNTGQRLSEKWFQVTNRNIRNTDDKTLTTVDKSYPQEYLLDQMVTGTVETFSSPGSGDISYITNALNSVTPGHTAKLTQKGQFFELYTETQPGNRGPRIGTSLDERTGKTFLQTDEIVLASEVEPESVDKDGYLVSYEPHNAILSRKTIRRLVSGEVISWIERQPFYWPAVLLEAHLLPWNRKYGDPAFFLRARLKQEHREIQPHYMRQWWQLADPMIVNPAIMVPDEMIYHCPIFSVQIPPCLHGPQTFGCIILDSVVWVNGSDSITYAATNYTDWPESFTTTEAKPMLGGYLVTEATVKRPDHTGEFFL